MKIIYNFIYLFLLIYSVNAAYIIQEKNSYSSVFILVILLIMIGVVFYFLHKNNPLKNSQYKIDLKEDPIAQYEKNKVKLTVEEKRLIRILLDKGGEIKITSLNKNYKIDKKNIDFLKSKKIIKKIKEKLILNSKI